MKSHLVLNSVPNNEIVGLSKFKAFADDILDVYQKLKFALGWVENTVGEGENVGCQHFLLFPQCFRKASALESGLCGKELTLYHTNQTFHEPVRDSFLTYCGKRRK